MRPLVQRAPLSDKVAMLARSILRQIVDFALPPRCPGCGTVTAEPHLFCLACWDQLDFLSGPGCVRCARPFEHDGGGAQECARCLAAPPDFGRLRAAVAYGDIARKVALKLKYGGRPGVAGTIAFHLARPLAALAGSPLAEADLSGKALLVPVPLHRWRIWKRGFNQSALIAAALARRSGHDVALDALRRIRATPALKGKGRRERAETVRGAFAVPPAARRAIEGRRVVLVDDVYTTGATANACARTLRKAGAAEVDLLCWARVVDPDH